VVAGDGVVVGVVVVEDGVVVEAGEVAGVGFVSLISIPITDMVRWRFKLFNDTHIRKVI
jgi:hypothetical protein